MKKLPFTAREIRNDVELAFSSFVDPTEKQWQFEWGSSPGQHGLTRCYVKWFNENGDRIMPGTRRYAELFQDLCIKLLAWRLSR